MTANRFKKLSALALVGTAVVLMTGCTVSEESRNSCENSGGEVKSERLIYKESDSFFGDSTTGDLRYCETSDGLIGDVYNENILEVSTGFLGASEKNNRVFEECEKLDGITYKTKKSNGKTTNVRYACVKDGQYVMILKELK